MLQHLRVVLLVVDSNVKVNQSFDLHLFQNILLAVAVEVIAHAEAVSLHFRNKAVVKAESPFLILSLESVIHRVGCLDDWVASGDIRLGFDHSSVPILHPVQVVDGPFFECSELSDYFAMLLRHLGSRVHRVLLDDVRHLLKTDSSHVVLLYCVRFLELSPETSELLPLDFEYLVLQGSEAISCVFVTDFFHEFGEVIRER